MLKTKLQINKINTTKIIFAIFILIFVFSPFAKGEAAINKQINYQGKLTGSSGVAVSNGTYNMEFKLYTVSSGGTAIWTETRTDANKVQVTSGLFSVLLGEVSTLDNVDFNQTLYLGVNIGGTAVSPAWDGEMTPRKKLGTVPSAVVAEKAINILGGSAGYVPFQTAANTTSFSSNFFWDNSTAKLGIGTTAPVQKLTISGGNIKLDDSYYLDWSNGSERITGTGLSGNYSLKFETYNGSALTEKMRILGNGNIGIGTTAPNALLHLSGSAGSNGPNSGLILNASYGLGTSVNNIDFRINGNAIRAASLGAAANVGGADLTFYTSSNFATTDATEKMRIDKNGNVGIGTTAPGFKLDVNGISAANQFYSGGVNITSSGIWGVGSSAEALIGFGSAQAGGARPWNFSSGGTGKTGGYFTWNIDTVEKMRLDNSGNVGIGTTAPGAKLHVEGTNEILSLTGTTPYLRFFANPSQSYIGSGSGLVSGMAVTDLAIRSASNIGFSIGTSEKVRIDSSGNVGIGTTAPVEKLNVNGNINITGGELRMFNNSTVLAATSSNLLSINNGGFSNVAITNGNIGIGTTTPAYKLHVNGVAYSSSYFYAPEGIFTSVQANKVFPTSSVDLRLQTRDNTDNILFEIDTNAPSEKMRITSAGNVGIGTTAPTYKLQVATAVNSAGIVHSNSSNGTRVYTFIDSSDNGLLLLKNSSNIDNINLNTGGNSYLNGGNVGIGTTAPGQKLDVVGGSIRTDNQLISTIATGTSPLSILSTTKVTNLNADILDGYHYNSFIPVSGYHFTNGYLIATDISAASNTMFSVEITGNSYGDGKPIHITLQGYNYTAGDAIINYSGVAEDWTRTVKAFNYNGYLYFWLDQSSSFQSITAYVKNTMETNNVNHVTAITNEVEPTTGTTRKVSIVPKQIWNSGNDGVASTLDADLLDGQHGSYYQTALTNPVTGTGTTNYLSKFTGTSTLGNSLIFDNGTNVGIGTTAPTQKLSINGSVNMISNGAITFENTNNNGNWYIRNSGTNLASLDFGIGAVGASDKIRFDSNGNVGIGTTAPGATLDVAGTIRTTSTITTGSYFYNNSASDANKYLTNTPGPSYMGFRGHGINNNTNSVLSIGYTTLPSTLISPVLSVVDNGNVGIGTTAPTQMLQIGGNTTSSIGMRIAPAGANWDIVTDGSQGLNIKNGNGNYLTFINSSQISSFTGNVGIGTTAPTAKLDINNGVNRTNNPTSLIVAGTGVLGTTAGSYLYPSETISNAGNTLRLQTTAYRRDAGSTWFGAGFRIQYAVDNSFTDGTGSFLEMGGRTDTTPYISLGTSGADRIYINSSGNVGIGTTSPSGKLEINGGAYDSSLVITTNVSSGADIKLNQTGTNGREWHITSTGSSNAMSAGGLQFYDDTAGAFRMGIQGSTGNVGINTGNPQAKLHIYNATAGGLNETIRSQGYWSAPGSGSLIRFTNYHASGTTPNTGEYNLAGIGGLDDNGGWGGSLYFQTAPTGTAGGAALQTRMTINPAGNVGIGTTSPGTKLNVIGNIASEKSAGGYVSSLFWQGNDPAIGYYSENGLLFGTETTMVGGAFSEKMRITNAGNVGIGTTAPAQALDVAGVINASTGFRIGNAATSGNYLRGNGTNFVSSAIQAGDVPTLNQNTAGYAALLVSEDNRTISPSELAINRLKFGFTSWANNDSSPYADFLHLRSYADSSGGADNLIMFNKSVIAMRIYQQTFGSATAYSSYRDVITTNTSASGTANYLPKFSSGTTIANSLIFDNGTNVGIGLTNPEGKMHIIGMNSAFPATTGTVQTGLEARFQPYDSNGVLDIGVNSGSGAWLQSTNRTSLSSNYPLLLNPNGGNVGIGTTAPATNLDVVGDIRASDTSGNYIYLDTTGANPGIVSNSSRSINIQPGSGLTTFYTSGTAGTLQIYDGSSSYPIILRAGGNSIFNGGSVGIGTASPASKLHVYDNNATTDHTIGLTIEQAGTGDAKLQWLTTGVTRFGMGIDNSDGDKLKISAATDLSTNNVLTIDSSSNVGIGTASPGVLLHLSKNGTASTQTVMAVLESVTSQRPVLQFSEGGYGLTSGMSIEYDGRSGGRANLLNINDINGVAIGTFMSGGNFGIQTTSPTANLTVAQSTAGVGTVSNTAGGTTVTGNGTEFTNTFKVGDTITVGGQTVAISAIASDTSMTTAAITNANTNAAYTLVGGTRMVVKGNGNVGIGLTNPSARLHISEAGPAYDWDSLRVDFQANGNLNSLNSSAGRFINTLAPSSQSYAIGSLGEAIKTGHYGYTATGAEGRGIYRSNSLGTSLASLDLYGVSGKVSVEGTGANTINSGKSLYAYANVDAGNILSTYWGVYVKSPSGTGTITNKYALVTEAGAGNVGIGLTNPGFPLAVQGTIQGRGIAYFTQASPTNSLAIDATSTTLHKIYTNNAGIDLSLGTNSSTSQLYLQSAGNVGIGTTSPGAKLDILGSNSAMALNLRSSSGQIQFFPYSDNKNYIESVDGTGTASQLLYFTGYSGTAGTFSFNGNVGIGMTSPTYKLDLQGSAWNNIARIYSTGSSSGLDFYDSGVRRGVVYSDSSGFGLLNSATSWAIKIPYGTGNVVVENGNMGVGTSSPSAKLDVVGNIELGAAVGTTRYILTDETNTGTGKVAIQAGAGSAAFGGAINLYAQAHATNPGWVQIGIGSGAGSGGTEGRFTVNNQGLGGGTDVFTVLRTGNVGIGTTGPSQKLEVNGNALVTKLGIGQLDAANYVLDVGGAARISSSGNVNFNQASGAATFHGQVNFPGSGVWQTSGNVGIGTTSPNQRLEIGSSGNYQMRIGNGSTAAYSYDFGRNTTDGLFYLYGNQTGANGYVFSGINGERMRINESGNVGIGTTAPGTKLDIAGTMHTTGLYTASAGIQLEGQNLGWDQSGVRSWTMGTAASSGNMTLKSGDEAGIFRVLTTTTSLSGNLIVSGTTNSSIAGNLGIGTINPGADLVIENSGTNNTQLWLQNTGTGITEIGFDSANGDFAGSDYMSLGQNDSLDGYIKMFANAGRFHIDTGGVERFTILQNGNLGIGTTAPGSRLVVSSAGIVAGTPEFVVGDYGTIKLKTYQTGSTYAAMYTGNNEDLRITAGTDNSQLVLKANNGNIGIGTASPTAFKLQVAGSVGPNVDNSYDLGSSGARWRNLYISGTIAQGGYLDNSLDNLVYNGDFETNSTNGWTGGGTAIVTGGHSGNYAMQVTGNQQIESVDYIPVNPVRDILQLEIYAKKSVAGTTPGILYLGYIAYDANKAAIYTAPCGSYCYFAASAYTLPADGNWHKFNATTNGEGTVYPNFPVGTKFVRVLGLINYSGSADAVTLIDHITLKRLNYGPTYIGNNFGTTNQADQTQLSKLYTTSVNNLIIDTPASNGNIGFGITNPNPFAWSSKAFTLQSTGTNTYSSLEAFGTGTGSGALLLGNSTIHRATISTADGSHLTFSTNNNNAASYMTEKMRITATGNVGIGTTSPDQLLQVNGASGTAISIKTPWAASAYGQLRFDTGTGSSSIRSSVPGDSTNGLQFFTYSGGETVKMSITGAGNVGIGLTNPAYKLDVVGGIHWNPGVTGSPEGFMSGSSAEQSIQLGSLTNSPLSLTTNALTRLFIDGNGNVGIGTTVPTYKVDIASTGNALKIGQSGTATNTIYQTFTNGGGSVYLGIDNSGGNGLFTGGAGYAAAFGHGGNYPIEFATNSTVRMLIDGSGNVGVGTATPQYGKLEIATTASNVGGLTLYRGTGTTARHWINSSDVYLIQRAITDTYGIAIDNVGNVGIGTTSPVSILNINATSPVLTLTGSTSGQETIASQIHFAVGNYSGARIKAIQTGASYGYQVGLGFFTQDAPYDANSFERMRISSTGNVGIGTTAPGKTLDIAVSPNASNGILVRDNNDATKSILITSSQGSTAFPYIGTNGNRRLDFGTNTARQMTIDTTGNVGIGTTAPNAPLSFGTVTGDKIYLYDGSGNYGFGVDSGGASQLNIFTGNSADMWFRSGGGDGTVRMAIVGTTGNVGIGTTAPGNLLNIYRNSSSTLPITRIEDAGTGDASMAFALTGVAGFSIGIDNSDDNKFKISGSGTDVGSNPYLTILGTGPTVGNVGIGTTSPGTKLQIVDSDGSNGTIGVGINSRGTFGWNNAGQGTLEIKNNLTSGSPNAITFWAAPTSGTVAEMMRIQGNGNVGIGTTAPGAKLEVVGNTYISGISSGTGNRLSFDTTGGAASNWIGTTNDYWTSIVNGRGSGSRIDLATNDIRFTFGSDVGNMLLKANGNLGIQTVSPVANFQVSQSSTGVGTVTTNGTTTLTGSGTQFTNTFKVGDTITVSGETVRTIATIVSDTSLTTTVAFSTTASSLSYTLTGGDRFVVKGNGNVGIGTTAPNKTLHVIGDVRGGAYYNNNSGDGWLINQDSGTNRGLYYYNTTGTWDLFDGGTSKISMGINGNIQMDGILTVSGTGNTTIAGNVGIGTTAPVTRLDVRALNALDGITLSANSGGSSVFRMVNPTVSNNLQIGTLSSNDVDIIANGSSKITILNANGNVGIGTTSPAQKLTISGGNIGILGQQDLMLYDSDSSHYSGFQAHATTTSNSIYTMPAAFPGSTSFMKTDSAGNLSWDTSTYITGNQSISLSGDASGSGTTAITVTNNLLTKEDNRTISPSELTTGKMRFGFTSWANNDSSPYADFLHLRSYTDASGGTDNLVMFNKSVIAMRIYQQTYGSATAYSSYRDVLTTDTGTGGTANYIPKFTGGTTLANSLMFDNGTNVGVGTTAPSYKLDVSGQIRANAGAGVAGIFTSTADYQLALSSSDSWTGIGFDDSGAINDSIWYQGTTGTFAIGGGGSSGVTSKKLHIDGATTIGANYDATAIPTNGLRVEGQTWLDSNVGIGTTNPFQKFEIDLDPTNTTQPTGINGTGTDPHTGMFILGTGNANNEKLGLQIGLWSNGTNKYSIGGLFGVMTSASGNTIGDLTFDLRSNVNDSYLTERMRITNAGNLGIQTASPVANFQVSQSTTGVGTVATNGTTTLTGTGTQFTNTFKVGDTITVSGETVRTIATIVSDTSLATTVAFTTTASSLSYTLTGGDRFVVKGNGNVGIGTTAPNKTLHVIGDVRGGAYYNNNSGDGWLINQDSGTNRGLYYYNTAGTWDLFDGGTSKISMGINGNIQMDGILTVSGTGNTTIAGNVGIGTTAPGAKLQVQGAIKIQNIVPSSPDQNFRRMINVASYQGGGTIRTGILTVKLPTPLVHSMGKIKISGWSYGQSWEIDVSGYMHPGTGSGWTQVGGTVVSGNPPFSPHQVKLVAETTTTDTFYVLLGNASTNWGYYASVGVDVDSYYSDGLGSTGWDISIAAAEPAYDTSIVPTVSSYGSSNALISGNVGIGTTAPIRTLEVNGGIQASSAGFYLGTNSALAQSSSTIKLGWVDRGELANTFITQIFSGGTGTTTTPTMTLNGNVGVGITNPIYKLDVSQTTVNNGSGVNVVVGNFNSTVTAGSGAANAGSAILRVSVAGGPHATDIEQNDGGSAPFRYGTYMDTNIVNKDVSSGAYGNINFVTGSSTSTSSVVMTIGGGTQKGFVGIGATPTSKLSIQNNGASDNILSNYAITNGNNAATFRTSDTGPIFGIHAQNNGAIYIKDTSDNVLFYGSNGGNVGIGTTAPGVTLDAYGRIRAGTSYRTTIFGDGTGSKIMLGSESDEDSLAVIGSFGTSLQLDSYNGPIVFKYSSAEKMRIGTDGNVGIGTTAPASRLHVSTLSSNDGALGQRWSYNGGDSSYYLDLKQTVTAGIVRWNFSQLNNGTAYNNVLVLDRGNVGIGTTAPGTKVDVIGGDLQASGFGHFKGWNTAGATGLGLDVGISSNQGYIMAYDRTASTYYPLRIVASNNTGSDGLTLATNGNVGIGTTAPSRKLDVAGSIVVSANEVWFADNTVARFGKQADHGTIIKAATGTTNDFALAAPTGSILMQNPTATANLAFMAGNLGINTTNPKNKLDIYFSSGNYSATAYNASPLVLSTPDYATDSKFSGIRFTNVSGNRESMFGTVQTSQNQADFVFQGYNATAVAYQEYLRIKNDGKVGIGTTAPSSNLTMVGANGGMTEFSIFDYAGTVAGFQIRYDDSTGATYLDNRYDNASGDIFIRTKTYGTAVNALTIESAGNIGIGTTAPGSILHLNVASGVPYQTFSVANTPFGYVGAAGAFFSGQGTNFGLYGGGSSNIMIGARNSADLTIATSGNVGIGTTSPGQKLSVVGNIDLSGSIGGTGMLYIGKSGTKTGLAYDSSNQNYGIFYTEGATDAVSIAPNGGGDTTPVAYFSGNGNVGIGTTAPASALSLVGDIALTSGGYIYGDNTDPHIKLHAAFGAIIGYSTNELYIGSDYSFLTNGTTKMKLKNNGNLGIGTASPTANLQVAQISSGVGTVSNTAGGTTVTGVGTQFLNTFKVGDTVTIGGQTVAISAIASDTSMTTAAITNANTNVAYTLTGAVRFSVLGNGNVGISTTAPGELLSLGTAGTTKGVLSLAGNTSGKIIIQPAAAAGTYTLTLPTTDGDASQVLTTDGSGVLSWASAGGSSQWTTTGSNIYYNTGNVGIGTTAPTARLHIKEAISTTVEGLRIEDSTATGGYLKLSDASSVSGHFIPSFWSKGIGTGAADRNGFMIVAEPGEDGADDAGIVLNARLNGAALTNASVLKIQNYATELMRIGASGNVGIGNTNPGYKLDIAGNINLQASGYLRTGSGDTEIGASSTDWYVKTYGGGALTERIRVTSTGNVGIGTNSPLEKLTVQNGSILASNGTIYAQPQSLTIFSNSASTSNSPTGYVYQSFTPTTDMLATALSVNLYKPGGISTIYYIYTANGDAPDQSLGFAMSGTTEVMGWTRLNLDTPIALKGGTKYVLYVMQSSGYIKYSNTDVYSGGVSSVGASNDMLFRIEGSVSNVISAFSTSTTNGSANSYQSFTTTTDMLVTAISANIYKPGGNYAYYYIYTANGDTQDQALGYAISGTAEAGGWTRLELPSPIALKANTKYVLYFTITGGYTKYSNTDVYSGGVSSVGASNDILFMIEDSSVTANQHFPSVASSSGTNLVVGPNGKVYKYSSSAKYKENITPLKQDFSKILEIQPVSYDYIATKTHDIGYTAESLDLLGLKDLVIYDSEGTPDAIKYDRISLYNLEVTKQQQNILNILNPSISKEIKQDILEYTDYSNALSMITKTPLYSFKYKDEVKENEEDPSLVKTRIGYMSEEVDPTFLLGDKIDQVSVNGLLIASIKELNLKIEELGGGQINTEGATVTFGEYASMFFNDVLTKVENGVAYMKNLAVETLKIGSPEKPSGITMYDEVTGDPYCFSISNGSTKTLLGECPSITLPSKVATNIEGTLEGGTVSSGDVDKPTITLEGQQIVMLDVGASYSEAGALAKDNVDGDVAVVISGSVDTSTAGIYTITYTATDSNGNTTTMTRTIQVGEVSMITPSDIPVTTETPTEETTQTETPTENTNTEPAPSSTESTTAPTEPTA
ncbi:MAG: DUF5011 domain-containing protein [Burkholderiales bacterium]|nr:DUF5011 domain-containing protein [Burkholderiales bacterium]